MATIGIHSDYKCNLVLTVFRVHDNIRRLNNVSQRSTKIESTRNFLAGNVLCIKLIP